MPNSPQSEFLREVVRDAVRRIEEVSDKLDAKIDSLEVKMTQDHKDLLSTISGRLEPLEKKVDDHQIKIVRHEHNFTILGFLVTGGLASVVGAFSWLSQFFGHK